MQKFCTNCGTPLNQDTFICPNCGALPDSAPNAYNQTDDPIVMQMPFRQRTENDSTVSTSLYECFSG